MVCITVHLKIHRCSLRSGRLSVVNDVPGMHISTFALIQHYQQILHYILLASISFFSRFTCLRMGRVNSLQQAQPSGLLSQNFAPQSLALHHSLHLQIISTHLFSDGGSQLTLPSFMFAMFLQSNDGQVCPRNSQQHSQKPKYESIYSDCIPLWRLAVRYW
jgi:hypothetical protein